MLTAHSSIAGLLAKHLTWKTIWRRTVLTATAFGLLATVTLPACQSLADPAQRGAVRIRVSDEWGPLPATSVTVRLPSGKTTWGTEVFLTGRDGVAELPAPPPPESASYEVEIGSRLFRAVIITEVQAVHGQTLTFELRLERHWNAGFSSRPRIVCDSSDTLVRLVKDRYRGELPSSCERLPLGTPVESTGVRQTWEYLGYRVEIERVIVPGRGVCWALSRWGWELPNQPVLYLARLAARDLVVREQPTDAAEIVATIEAGSTVLARPKKESDSLWAKVDLPDGSSGWVPWSHLAGTGTAMRR